MGPWVTAMSGQASDMSAWVLMGLPASIYAMGMGQTWIAIGLGIGYALSWIFMAPRLRRFSIAANDSIAVNLIAALKSRRVHIPKDVKVVGFDNSPRAKQVNPLLTSFNVDKIALGRKLTTLLLERVSNPTQTNQIIHISSKVIVRAST